MMSSPFSAMLGRASCPVLFLVLIFTVYGSENDAKPPNLVQITESNIEELIFSDSNTHDWLVMFGAPWCGWCQKLEPEFSLAAMEHAVERYNIKFAKADCTTEKSFNTRFGVAGYPTIKLFRDKTMFNVGQLRNSSQIDEYIHRIVTMPVLRYTPEPTPKEFRSDPHFVLVGNHLAQDPTLPVAERFSKAAWQMLPEFIRCYRVYEDIPIPYINRVALGLPDLKYEIIDSTETKVEDYLKFMRDNKKPLLSEVKVENFNELVQTRLQWLVLAVNPEKGVSALDVFRKVAASNSDEVLFVWVNSLLHPEWVANFGVDANRPGMFMYDPNMERHWRASNVSLDSEKEIIQFIADVKAGKIETKGFGLYHPAYLLRRFHQWFTSSFYEYSFNYQFTVTAFCISSSLVAIVWFCLGLVRRPKTKKDKQQ